MNILVCFVEIITKGNTDQFLNLGKLKISLKSNIEKKKFLFFLYFLKMSFIIYIVELSVFISIQ